MTDTKRLAYRPDEAAELAGISRDTLYELIAAGKLKTVKIGRCRVITAKVLNAMLENGVS